MHAPWYVVLHAFIRVREKDLTDVFHVCQYLAGGVGSEAIGVQTDVTNQESVRHAVETGKSPNLLPVVSADEYVQRRS